jgi:hypothetical protein
MKDLEDFLLHAANTVVQAASDVVANVFNSTPAPFRPVALAALRISVEAAVATMDADDRDVYAYALEHLDCTTTKIQKGSGRL